MPLSLLGTIILPTLPNESEILGMDPATCVIMNPPGDAQSNLRTIALRQRVSRLQGIWSGHRKSGEAL